MERELMKKEALERLSLIGIMRVVIDDFEKEGKLYYSDRSQVGGILYWLDNQPKWVEKVRQVEEEYDILVYHMTHEVTSFGELLTLLYVSHHQDEWKQDKKDLEIKDILSGEFTTIAYVLNLDDPICSEFGSVSMKVVNGGLIRTA